VSALWVLPLCVLAAGTVGMALVTRRLADDVAAARPDLTSLRRLAQEARTAAAELEDVRRRGAEVAASPARIRAASAAHREARRARTGR
jgi:hypothetical protein